MGKRALFCAGLILVAVTSVFVPSATAAAVCGGTITSSATLTTDLVCPGSGITIAEDYVTLDLGGHTISGSGSFGVRILSSYGARVKNGTIKLFDYGVRVDDSEYSVVQGLKTRSSSTGGVFVSQSSNTAVKHVTAVQGGWVGFIVNDSDRTLITNNEAKGNVNGVWLQTGTTTTRIIANSFHDNSGFGIDIEYGSQTVVKRNEVLDNSSDGIWVNGLAPVTGTQIVANQALRNGGHGITVEAADPGTSVRDNVANGNEGLGIYAQPEVDDAGGNSADGNGDSMECQNIACS
jgi:parallel beta-helix repeat protein